VRAIASLSDPGTNWRIGETVRASVPLAAARGKPQLAIPRAAVQTVEDKPSVFVRSKDGFSIRRIAVGDAAGGYLMVLSGLDGSERIAVSNTYILKAEHGKGEAGEDHD
jgi:cobalt-zinc-cadmium efflux system membrane fusion protein